MISILVLSVYLCSAFFLLKKININVILIKIFNETINIYIALKDLNFRDTRIEKKLQKLGFSLLAKSVILFFILIIIILGLYIIDSILTENIFKILFQINFLIYISILIFVLNKIINIFTNR
jgi:hypothetical protein